MIPNGKGVFVWQLGRCFNGNVTALAEALKADGYAWAAIKAADGANDFNQGATSWGGPNLMPAAVDALRQAGLKIFGWQYVYGNSLAHTALEAEAAVRNWQRWRLDGWILDPEKEYKRPLAPLWARALMTYLRQQAPTMSIGLCSYRFPTLHPQLPWKEFLQKCDFHAPQVYWVGANNPGAQLARSAQELQSLRELPFIPVGSAYSESGWEPTTAQLDEFNQMAKTLACEGVSWWCWDDNGIGNHPAWREAIAGHDWGAPIEPEPEPGGAHVRIKAGMAVNIRNEPSAAGGVQTIIGQAKGGSIWAVDGTAPGPDGRAWYRIGRSAYLAGWLADLID